MRILFLIVPRHGVVFGKMEAVIGGHSADPVSAGQGARRGVAYSQLPGGTALGSQNHRNHYIWYIKSIYSIREASGAAPVEASGDASLAPVVPGVAHLGFQNRRNQIYDRRPSALGPPLPKGREPPPAEEYKEKNKESEGF